jgi:hypothetical protein
MSSKVGFWQCQLSSKYLIFTRALCTHNGRSLQIKNLRYFLAKFPTFERICVYTNTFKSWFLEALDKTSQIGREGGFDFYLGAVQGMGKAHARCMEQLALYIEFFIHRFRPIKGIP